MEFTTRIIKAVQAVQELQKNGYKAQQISILGQAKNINNHIHVHSGNLPEEIEVSIGIIAGSILGILTGVGVFAIPGLGFLYGAGALVERICRPGFWHNRRRTGGYINRVGVDTAKASKYEHLLKDGKFIVVVQSSPEEIERVHQVLHTYGTYSELEAH